MALSEKHRSSIYQHLAELLGDEEADALLSQFPARDLDEPATKEFVRAEIAGVRTEIGGVRTEIGALRGELHIEIGALRGELHTEIAGVRGDMARLEASIAERFRQQTMWMTGTLITGMGVMAAVVAAIN